jgi:hypothetical protein
MAQDAVPRQSYSTTLTSKKNCRSGEKGQLDLLLACCLGASKAQNAGGPVPETAPSQISATTQRCSV